MHVVRRFDRAGDDVVRAHIGSDALIAAQHVHFDFFPHVIPVRQRFTGELERHEVIQVQCGTLTVRHAGLVVVGIVLHRGIDRIRNLAVAHLVEVLAELLHRRRRGFDHRREVDFDTGFVLWRFLQRPMRVDRAKGGEARRPRARGDTGVDALNHVAEQPGVHVGDNGLARLDVFAIFQGHGFDRTARCVDLDHLGIATHLTTVMTNAGDQGIGKFL